MQTTTAVVKCWSARYLVVTGFLLCLQSTAFAQTETGGTVTNNSIGDNQFPGKIKCSATVTPNMGSQVDSVEFVVGKVVNGQWQRLGGNDSALGVAGRGGVYTVTIAGIAAGNYVVRATGKFRPVGQVAPTVSKDNDKAVTVQ